MEIRMHSLCRLATAGFGLALAASVATFAQQPVAVPVPAMQPLQKMPYSPSLDVTSLDRSVDPCVDFYKFSCGGWIARNPIPADQAAWSVYAKLETDNEQFLWGILQADAKASITSQPQGPAGSSARVYLWIDEQGRPSHIKVDKNIPKATAQEILKAVEEYRFKPAMQNGRPVKVDLTIYVSMPRNPVQQKIGDYFSSCMDTGAIDAAGLKPLEPALDEVNGLRDRAALLAALPELRHSLPGSFFFNAGTSQDAVDSSLEIVSVNAGGLGLPDRDYYTKTDAHSVTLREQYRAFVAKMLTLAGEPQAQADTDAKNILRIETALAKAQLTRVERRDPHKTYHFMPVSQLQQLTPAVQWQKLLALEGASDVTKLNVAQPEFMQALQTVLTTEPVEALRAYLRFHLIAGAAPVLAAPVREANFDFYSHTLRGVAQEPPRWKTCVRAVDNNLGEALGQEFVARTFTADMKAKTELMTGQIEAEMGKEIEQLDWMSPATKTEALRKLHAIRNKIGYPAHWRDYTALQVQPNDYFGNAMRAYRFESARDWHKLGKPVDLNEWGMTPPTVNAYFNPQMNDINFPAGVLQPPLYDPSLDDAPNYGNTGATIGHELTHAFDDEGRQFDSKGNLRDWWTPADAKGFEDRINCVRDQYAGYTIIDNIHINSKLTSGEDVADLGGTLLAYLAWQVQEHGKTLHDIDGFTPEQRFFIGMGQWACESTRPETLRVNAITDPHSPGFARINGVVSNMPQFQKAFGCKTGQPMVHTPTCKVW